MSAVSVGRPLIAGQASHGTSGFTVERSPMSAWSVGNPSAGVLTSFDMPSSTLERSPTSAVNVERPLVVAHPLVSIKGCILAETLSV